MSSYGTAGGSLENADFAVSDEAARIGRSGEIAIGLLLDKLSRKRGFTVLHDLRIPSAKANIDHVVVSGTRVWLIDTKVWKPGVYLTLFGRTFRGFERVAHADKRGLPFGQRRIRDLLDSMNLPAQMQRPIMVVRPSTRGRVSLWGFRPASDPGARVRALHESQLQFPAGAGDARIVAALASLTN